MKCAFILSHIVYPVSYDMILFDQGFTYHRCGGREMDSIDLVKKTIRGENNSQTPVYGWVSANLDEEISQRFGSVRNFEDHYDFDMAHLFPRINPYDRNGLSKLREENPEITPEILLSFPLSEVDDINLYSDLKENLEFYRGQRKRFCYVQTPGIFECLNGPFGIENHLCWLALYPDEIKEVYKRQAQWNKKFISNVIDLGVDCVHISDDWGAQRGLMFSTEMFKELIYPYHEMACRHAKKRGVLLSLHSDGNVSAVVDDIIRLGYDMFHPWQESAGMSYDLYLEKYSEKIAILGGVCVQTTIGFNNYKKLEEDIKRVFSALKGKRWCCCTTHFVQNHCSMDELVFAYDLITKLARN
jgi:uroporphyrinogen decarboxylase